MTVLQRLAQLRCRSLARPGFEDCRHLNRFPDQISAVVLEFSHFFNATKPVSARLYIASSRSASRSSVASVDGRSKYRSKADPEEAKRLSVPSTVSAARLKWLHEQDVATADATLACAAEPAFGVRPPCGARQQPQTVFAALCCVTVCTLGKWVIGQRVHCSCSPQA